MKRLLTLLLALLPLQGESPFPSSLTAHLQEASILHLDFTQTRTLAALSRPLKSSGSLVLARDLGVIWELRRPAALTYVMGPKGLTVVTAQGRKERKSSREAPMVAQMGRIFQSLTQGDWHGLEAFFTVTGQGTAQRWEVTLLPKPPTAAFLKVVQLSGGRFMERIRLDEATGDRMEIRFEHQRTDAPLTEAEKSLLAQD